MCLFITDQLFTSNKFNSQFIIILIFQSKLQGSKTNSSIQKSKLIQTNQVIKAVDKQNQIFLIMNITRLNFAQSLPFIKNTIKQSHFISIDLEMSGIVSDLDSQPSLIDSIQQRYAKTRKRIQDFIPLQMGICCHKIDSSNNVVKFYPFNFYVYPLSIYQSEAVKFGFNSASLNFLAKNGFDFNKLFYEYVPFISKQDLIQINLRKQKSELIKQLMRLDALNSPTTKAFMNIHLPSIEKWICQNSQTQLKIDIKNMKFKSYKTMIDEIQLKYPSIAFQFTFDKPQIFNRSWLTIRKNVKPQQGLSFEQQPTEANQLVLMNEVMDSIVQSRIPIVVHNGVLDLMHVIICQKKIFLRFYQKFPPTWQSFCQKLHSVFPYIYDTKFICSNYPVIFQTLERQTNLQNCYRKLKEDYEKKTDDEKKDFYTIQIDSDFKEYTLEDTSCHEAGFDALMTGYVFFRAMNKLKKPLKSLASSDFHRNTSLMRNRIPLGNIKVPFNLEQKNDFYSQHANTIFEGKSLLNTVHTDEQIVEHFKKEKGAINFYWKDQTKTSFYLTFIDKKQQSNFANNHLDKDGLGIIEFLNDKYLFTTLKKQSNPQQSIHNQSQAKIH